MRPAFLLSADSHLFGLYIHLQQGFSYTVRFQNSFVSSRHSAPGRSGCYKFRHQIYRVVIFLIQIPDLAIQSSLLSPCACGQGLGEVQVGVVQFFSHTFFFWGCGPNGNPGFMHWLRIQFCLVHINSLNSWITETLKLQQKPGFCCVNSQTLHFGFQLTPNFWHLGFPSLGSSALHGKDVCYSLSKISRCLKQMSFINSVVRFSFIPSTKTINTNQEVLIS